MVTPPGRSRLLAHQVLERAVLYEMPPESAGQGNSGDLSRCWRA